MEPTEDQRRVAEIAHHTTHAAEQAEASKVGYFVEHVRMRECTCADLLSCPKRTTTLVYLQEEYDRLMLDFPCMTIVRDQWADRKAERKQA